MNKKEQHIGSLLTLFAGLIILVHAVVPHHHHFELTHSSEQESTCEKSPLDNNDKPDFHCHAFNIMVSAKAKKVSLNNSFPELFGSYLPSITTNLDTPLVKILLTKFSCYQIIVLKQYFTTAQSLRAPPSYS